MHHIFERLQRAWNVHAATYPFRLARARLRQLFGGPKVRRMLIASDGGAYTSEQQFAPIRRLGHRLQARFGLVTQHRNLDEVLALNAAALRGFDVVAYKLRFRRTAQEAASIAQQLVQRVAGTGARLVYFDGDDDLNIQWQSVIDGVDVYVKKHVFADSKAYTAEYIGKSNLTDHAAREHGVSFAEDIIPRSGGLALASVSRLHVGWNIALDDKIEALSRHVRTLTQPERDIDLSCRAWVKPEVWTHPLRNGVLERMEAMAPRFRILAPRDRVSQDKYYEEMLRSRICVSPFGFGEICWRDFEAILCGCLLVKPDMGHLGTEPNVFVPGVTYAPVRWDYSNLEEVCAEYLADEARRMRVVQAAQKVLLDSLRPEWFETRMAELLARLDAAAPR